MPPNMGSCRKASVSARRARARSPSESQATASMRPARADLDALASRIFNASAAPPRISASHARASGGRATSRGVSPETRTDAS